MSDVGARLFRRPLEAEEVDRYVGLFAPELTEGSFEVGVRLATTAILSSPSFLFRSEVGELDGDVYRLTPWEIAAALSYTLSGGPPDDRLRGLASAGTLTDETVIAEEARRLLGGAEARERVLTFAAQWLGTIDVLNSNKDATLYPNFTDDVRLAVVEEQGRFIEHVVFDSLGTLDELLTADYVFVNDALHAFYDLSGAAPGGGWARQSAGPTRGGVLRLGSTLASYAHANESSPIQRGLFVRDRLLCQDLPPPPPSADTTPPGLDPTLTTRERFARHTAEPSCRSCHQYIDEVGFGFEGYDAVGAYRTMEEGLPVDESGELRGSEQLAGADAQPFSGPGELGQLLATAESPVRCMARQWFRWGRGTLEQPADQCAVEELERRMVSSEGDLKDLFVTLFTQRSFLERRAPSES